jgi:hypothetical protein
MSVGSFHFVIHLLGAILAYHGPYSSRILLLFPNPDRGNISGEPDMVSHMLFIPLPYGILDHKDLSTGSKQEKPRVDATESNA